jgi:hypothetical protein
MSNPFKGEAGGKWRDAGVGIRFSFEFKTIFLSEEKNSGEFHFFLAEHYNL